MNAEIKDVYQRVAEQIVTASEAGAYDTGKSCSKIPTSKRISQ